MQEMRVDEKILMLDKLGMYLKTNMEGEGMERLFIKAKLQNPWFTIDNIKTALENIIKKFLNKDRLQTFLAKYPEKYFNAQNVQKVGVVAAGNVPFVGLQDLIHVLLSGHILYFRPSSQDAVLMTFLIEKLHEIESEIKDNLILADKLNGLDAYIATGSTNTSRYFDYYFGKKPHIIRKNRISVAVLDGNETTTELSDLGYDIFSYFGLGCRNVSKLFVPENYDFKPFFESIQYWDTIMLHNKYLNNYEYNKSILLVNREKHFDNGFLLVKDSEGFHSPISTVFYEEYKSKEEAEAKIADLGELLQCVVSHDDIPFGQTQSPELWDYADGVDTIEFLEKLV